jgi:hypothetical protein
VCFAIYCSLLATEERLLIEVQRIDRCHIYCKNLLQLHTMENERDISFDSQQKFKAQIYERKKFTTIFEITCVIIQNVNSGSVF